MIQGFYEKQEIYIDGELLDLSRSRQLRDHASAPLWGYFGSGPAQAALALLLWMGATDQEALRWYQEFKSDVIAQLPQTDFELDSGRVWDWLDARRIFSREFEKLPAAVDINCPMCGEFIVNAQRGVIECSRCRLRFDAELCGE